MKKQLYILFIFLSNFTSLYVVGQSTEDSLKVEAWIKKADSLSPKVKPEALVYADSALVFSTQIDYTIGRGKAFLSRGLAHDYAGNLEKAISDYDSSIVIFQSVQDNKSVGRAISNKGVCYLFVGRYDEAVENFLASLPYMKKAKHWQGVASVLNNLGLISRRKGDYIKAISYYEESVDYKKRFNDQKGLMTTYLNMSSLYYYLEDLDKSLKYNQMSSQIALELDDQITFSENEIHRATLLHEQGKQAQAIVTFKSVLGTLKSEGVYKNLTVAYSGLGDAYLIDGLLDSAQLYFELGLEVLDDYDVAEYRLEMYRGLSDVYYEKGEFQLSRDYLEKYIDLNKEIESNSQSEEIKELESKYNYLSQKERIDRFRKEKVISELREKRSQFIQMALWISAIVLLLIVLVIIYFYRNIKREKKKTEAALKDKELLLKEIHHRVKNNLQMVSSLLYLQADNIQDDTALEAIELSRSRVDSMAIIHQELYSHEDSTGVETHNYIVNLTDAILDTMGLNEDSFRIDYKVESLILDVETMIPLGLIINELITNVFKHAFSSTQKEKKLNILLLEKSGKLIFEIQDNGEGNKDLNPKHSSGFGTRLIDLFLKKLDATKTIKKENGYLVRLEIAKYIVR